MMVKNMYRYPLMIGLPNFFEKHFPARHKDNKKLQKLCAGFSIAAIESVILCPFERLKTYFMTARSLRNDGRHAEEGAKVTLSTFIKESDSGLVRSLFKGVGPLFLRQSIAWVCFLQADLRLKQAVRKIKNIPEEDSIPTKYLMVASVVGAVISTIIIMPFDSLKTNQQLYDKQGAQQERYSEISKRIYAESGVRGFFVGWRIRFSMYLIHALFTIDILERLDTI
jgi:hypothetical protein